MKTNREKSMSGRLEKENSCKNTGAAAAAAGIYLLTEIPP